MVPCSRHLPKQAYQPPSQLVVDAFRPLTLVGLVCSLLIPGLLLFLDIFALPVAPSSTRNKLEKQSQLFAARFSFLPCTLRLEIHLSQNLVILGAIKSH